MNLRQLLHGLRRIDTWLVLPAILVVIYGELVHSAVVAALETEFWDKVLHFAAYFGLALMTTIATRADRRALWWALGLIAMGGVLEIIQGITGRDADIFDELANTIGVLAGLAVGWTGITILRTHKILNDGSDQPGNGPLPGG
jgi:VanZ family protein